MQPMTELDAETLRDYYGAFSRLEASGTSPIYTSWAEGVATDDEVIALLLELPRPKRQANLLFAAARHLGAGEGTYADLRDWLLDHWGDVRQLMLARSTQTNEAGRCATLLLALTRIPGPLALIEVGASAGLCLYPDRYSYRYTVTEATGTEFEQSTTLDPADGPSAVVLDCELTNASVPEHLPEVVWRAGLDLNPLDITDADQREWLTSLVWPEHESRRERLLAAASIAAADPRTLSVATCSTPSNPCSPRCLPGLRRSSSTARCWPMSTPRRVPASLRSCDRVMTSCGSATREQASSLRLPRSSRSSGSKPTDESSSASTAGPSL